MEIGSLGRVIALVGAGLLVLGLLLVLLGRLPVVGHLPGDLLLRRGGLTIYVPLATMLVVSIVLTLLLTIVLRLSRPS